MDVGWRKGLKLLLDILNFHLCAIKLLLLSSGDIKCIVIKGPLKAMLSDRYVWITCLQRCDKQICDIFGWRLARPDWAQPSMGKTMIFYSAALFVAFPFLAVTMNTIMAVLTFIQGKGHIIARGCPRLTQNHFMYYMYFERAYHRKSFFIRIGRESHL